MPLPFSDRKSFSSSLLAVVCSLLIVAGGLLTAFAFAFSQQRITERATTRFEEITNGTTTDLLRNMETYANALYAMRGLFAAANVDNEAWERFVRSQSAPNRFAGMRAIAYAQIVPDSQLQEYERMLQSTQDKNITIHPGFKAGEHIILTYHEEIALPYANLVKVMGYDYASSPERFAAFEQARKTGSIAATGRLDLIPTGNPGFILILPLTERFDQTNTTTFGYGIAGFEMPELVSHILGPRLDQYHTSIKITDITGDQPTELYTRQLQSSGRTTKRTMIVHVADRTWQITFEAPTSILMISVEKYVPLAILAVGFGFTAAMCILTYALRLRRKLKFTLPPIAG